MASVAQSVKAGGVCPYCRGEGVVRLPSGGSATCQCQSGSAVKAAAVPSGIVTKGVARDHR